MTAKDRPKQDSLDPQKNIPLDKCAHRIIVLTNLNLCGSMHCISIIIIRTGSDRPIGTRLLSNLVGLKDRVA